MPCFVCNCRFMQHRIMNGENQDPLIVNRRQQLAIEHRRFYNLEEANVNIHSMLCLNCDRRMTKIIEDEQNDDIIKFKVLFLGHNTRLCFICNLPCRNRLSLYARVNFFIRTDIFISNDVSCCGQHLSSKGGVQIHFMDNRNFTVQGVNMTAREVISWFNELRVQALNNDPFNSEDDFDNEDFKHLTSLDKDQFITVFDYCSPILVYGNTRYISKKELIAFLMKLRQGLSDDFIKSLMNFSSRQAVSLAIIKVRESLMTRFVPDNLGITSNEVRDREHFMEHHVPEFHNRLYNPNPERSQVILYPDCTYIKVPKSSNFKVARMSYSFHKHYSLLKVGLVVAGDGYIVDVHGPYFSDTRNNDASILYHDMNRDGDHLRGWLQNGDIFVVGRGYRDAVAFLNGLNLNCEMPALLPRNQRQFTTEQANQSRLVTKTRWIVESRNGHLKSVFKFFRDIIPMQHLSNLGDFVRIACALVNRFHDPIHMVGANEALAVRMLELAQTPNRLQERVERDGLHRRVGNGRWIPMTEHDLPGFPHLPLEYVLDLTFGTYQVYLAPSYIQDTNTRNNEDEFVFEIQEFEVGLIRARIWSRFQNSSKHMMYISYIDQLEIQERDRPGPEPILGTYCTCKAGARTLGVCSHIACVLYQLGYARHEENVRIPPTALLRTILDSADRNNEPIVLI